MWTYQQLDASVSLQNDGKARYVFNVLDEEGVVRFGHVSVACKPSEADARMAEQVAIYETLYGDISSS